MPATQPTYILDGHNLLYAARQAFLEHLVDGHPGSAAREALVQHLLRAFPPPGPEVLLVFDGSEAKTEARSARLQVIYSGGEGEQRADKAILRLAAQHVQADNAAPMVVVTRDIKLARRARKRGASVVDPAEFLLVLDAAVQRFSGATTRS